MLIDIRLVGPFITVSDLSSDCRNKDDYDESHIITSKKAPKVMHY